MHGACGVIDNGFRIFTSSASKFCCALAQTITDKTSNIKQKKTLSIDYGQACTIHKMLQQEFWIACQIFKSKVCIFFVGRVVQ
jgi:hypothetical protein